MNYEKLEIFELLAILKICLIIQTIGFFGCMENQTDKGYNKTTTNRGFGKKPAGNGIFGFAGF
ncbi:MAG: hypothetical protein LBT87_11200 [Treponema sp.]|jgi:hypothetical protein|nr:hypothetical protein [Treponema sp.]